MVQNLNTHSCYITATYESQTDSSSSEAAMGVPLQLISDINSEDVILQKLNTGQQRCQDHVSGNDVQLLLQLLLQHLACI